MRRADFTVYLPLARLKYVRSHAGRVEHVTAIEPLFKGYLFVQASRMMAKIRTTRGVAALLSSGGAPTQISAKIIDDIRSRETVEDGVSSVNITEERAEKFASGDKVAVDSGPFAGLPAVFQKRKGAERAAIMLKLFGTEREVTVSIEDLRAA